VDLKLVLLHLKLVLLHLKLVRLNLKLVLLLELADAMEEDVAALARIVSRAVKIVRIVRTVTRDESCMEEGVRV
jgi:hypothetical protein